MFKREKKPESNENRSRRAEPSQSASRLNSIVFFLLCATLVFSVLAFGANDTWALGVLSFLSGLIVLFWTFDAFVKKEFQYSSSLLQLPLLGLILIGLIQLLPLRGGGELNDLLSVPANSALSLAPYSTRFALIQLSVYFIFFAAAFVSISTYKRMRKIVLLIVVFGSIMAFYGILQRLANIEEIYGLRPPGQAVPFSSFINQHHFAAFMEMTLGVVFGLLFGKSTKKDKQLLLVIAAVVMGMAVVFTSSRGGMLGLLSVLGFVIAANLLRKPPHSEEISDEERHKNYRRRFALIGAGLMLIFVLFGSVILLGGDASLLRGIGLQNPNDPTNGRTHFWQIALKIFFDYPILGAGLESYGMAFTRYDSWNGLFRVEQAHNDYLQILADAGIAGFLCVAAFVFLLFKYSLRVIDKTHDSFRRGTAIGALAGCFGILIHSFFDFPLRTTSNAFFFLTLTVLATASISSPKHRKRKN